MDATRFHAWETYSPQLSHVGMSPALFLPGAGQRAVQPPAAPENGAERPVPLERSLVSGSRPLVLDGFSPVYRDSAVRARSFLYALSEEGSMPADRPLLVQAHGSIARISSSMDCSLW